VQVAPRPSEIIKSLRGLGYRPATAVADLIDNSLSAGAKIIQAEFLWDENNPCIRITDDGRGMTNAELVEAMRLGRDPTTARVAGDLGRFGLGLKTASLSQARVLTVCSKAEGHEPAIFRWDIDHVATSDRWDLQSGPLPNSEHLLQRIATISSGTIVLWEKPDVLLADTNGSIDALFEIADAVGKYVGMVFHRFIANGRVTITINGAPVRPWDPFMSGHPECEVDGPKVLGAEGSDRKIVATGYILPPRSRLSSDDYEIYAGPEGWIAQQGFYVYRDDRLVVAGGWLGLGRGGKAWRLDRFFSLARISLEITNSADMDWRIDLRKSSASPPPSFKQKIRQFAEEIRRRSKSALRALQAIPRERNADERNERPIWIPLRGRPLPQFRIDRRHPAVKSVRNAIGNRGKLKALLNLLDREMPIQPPSLAAPNATVSSNASRELQESSIRPLVRTVYYSLRNGSGLGVMEAKQKMLSSPAFRDHEAFVIVTIDEYELELRGHQ
jgi:hypothetical protein